MLKAVSNPKKNKLVSRQKLLSVTASDCRFDAFIGSGDGGQKRQKTASAIRCTHLASGAVGKATESRLQGQNRKTAFERMTETEEFKKWLKIEIARKAGGLAKIEAEVDADMKRVKVESKDEKGRWVDGLTSTESDAS
jgi:protein subunit release factor B